MAAYTLPLLNNQILAEGTKPVEVPDPIAQMREVESLRAAKLQNALGPLRQQQLQGEVQQTQLANQNTIENNADQDTIQQELRNPANQSKDQSGNMVPDH